MTVAVFTLLGGQGVKPLPPPPFWPYPDDDWPAAAPEDVGLSRARLRAVSAAAIGNATVIRHGYEAWTYGDVGSWETNWASCARSYVTMAWGRAMADGHIPGGLAALEAPVAALPSARARTFGSAIKLKHLLSYTSQAYPPGSHWSYSSGQHWYDQHVILNELLGQSVARYLTDGVLEALGRRLRAGTVSDGTVRVYGSPRDQARWAYLWLRGGSWKGQPLVDPEFVRRSVAGGPDGDGRPMPTEGWQIHKVSDGRHSEGPMPGVPDDAFFAYGATDLAVIAVVPSLDLVVARKRSGHGYPIETFLGPICQAVEA